MSKKSSVIPKKKNYLTGLKELSKWFFSKRSEKEIEDLIYKYEWDNFILKRLTSYVYNYPHLVWYINKYMNGLYQFQKFDLVSMFYTFGYLLDINQRNQMKKLFFLKSNDLLDKNKQKIKELLLEFFDQIYDKHCNDQELNFFYDLIHLNVIPLENIQKIDEYLNSGKQTIDLSLDEPHYKHQDKNESVLDMYQLLPDKIQQFCDEIKTIVLTRPECQKCELFGKTTVVLDTNATDFEEVDIVFLGLNPGSEESKIGKPFVGKSGKFLREKIATLPANIKWLIGNVILCFTRTEKEIKDPDTTMSNCLDLQRMIYEKFPSRIFVPLGAKAASTFQFTDSITSISGKVFKNNEMTIIPLIHPSSAVNYGQMNKFVNDFKSVQDLFNVKTEVPDKQMKKVTQVSKTTSNFEIKQSETISTKDLTFFDVREVNGQIIKIFIDSEGRKKYITEDYKVKFNVKYDNWDKCNQIVDKIDYIVEISGKEKMYISTKVREKLNQLKSI
jgi:DNA polymerase